MVRRSASNVPRCLPRTFKKRLRYISAASLFLSALANQTQDFRKEAVTWKYLDHPNVLPLLGITIDPLQLVSKWVSSGNMREYIKRHPDADRRRLVGVPFAVAAQPVILLPAVRHR